MIYLAVAFIAVWLLVALYVLFLASRQRRLEEEFGTLEEMVAERRGRAAQPPAKPEPAAAGAAVRRAG